MHVPPAILPPLAAAPPAALTVLWAVLLIMVLFMLIVTLAMARVFSLYLQALMANTRISIWELIGMRFRKVDSKTIVRSMIAAKQAGLNLTTPQLEIHHLAGGHVRETVRAMIAAHLATIELPWNTACAMDLAGKDVQGAVEKAIDAKATTVSFS